MKDFISIADCTKEELREFLDVAKRLKKQYKTTGRNDPLLAGKMLGMIFEKPSLRTRVSFAVAMQHLGGAAIMLRQEEVGLGQREAVKDVARVLSGMCDGVTLSGMPSISSSWRRRGEAEARVIGSVMTRRARG